MTMSKFLPFALPDIGQEEIDEVMDTMKSGWLTTGPKAERFELDFARYIGVSHAMAVNSATAGLHLALEAIGVRYGDKVVTTPYTFTASAEVIRYLGADPVFVDIDPVTFNLDPQKIDAAVSDTTGVKAIIPVHFAGQACDMDSILDLAKEKDLKVIEDAAHCLPSTYKGRMIGTIGDLTVFSFYVTKAITTGEGGMVVTNTGDYTDRIKANRLHGISRDVFQRYSSRRPSWYYEVISPGFKYNMTDLGASIGIHQLRKASTFQKRRQKIASRYSDALSELPVKVPTKKIPDDIHAWHLYVIQLELERLTIDRDRFIEMMADEGIGTSVHFIPLHLHPYWRNRYGFKPDSFPVALDVFQRAVSLPIFSKMTDSDVDRVIDCVTSILRKTQR